MAATAPFQLIILWLTWYSPSGLRSGAIDFGLVTVYEFSSNHGCRIDGVVSRLPGVRDVLQARLGIIAPPDFGLQDVLDIMAAKFPEMQVTVHKSDTYYGEFGSRAMKAFWSNKKLRFTCTWPELATNEEIQMVSAATSLILTSLDR